MHAELLKQLMNPGALVLPNKRNIENLSHFDTRQNAAFNYMDRQTCTYL